MGFTTDTVRTIAVAGHGQSGKTSLVEHLLAFTGEIDKAETIDSGNTVSDYTQEEIDRKISIHSTLVNLKKDDKLINIWDTPGSSDFIGEVITAFRASETALMVLDARSGVQIETIKYWRDLDRRNKPRIVFVNKMDEDRANFDNCIKDVKKQFSVDVFPVTIPMGASDEFKGVIDVLHGKAYKIENGKEVEISIPDEYQAQYKDAVEVLAGAAAEGDDDLLVKFIDEGELTSEEISKGLTLAMADNRIVPIFAGSALQNSGLTALLSFISEIMPSPQGFLERGMDSNGNGLSIKVDPTQPFSAFVLKTSNDQFSGRLSFVKVITGNLNSNSDIYNLREQKKEKLSKIYKIIGKKLVEVSDIPAGDIGVLVKLGNTKTNDTLAYSTEAIPFVNLRTPAPIYSLAVSATEKKNDDKVSEQLFKACEEDTTLSFVFNPETKQNVLSGMGDLHTTIVLDKVVKQSKVELETSMPRIAYRETIQRKSQAEYTHKKQSGGHGQFGKVVLSIEPLSRGERYKFTNAIYGGAISKGYIPGVEKGVIEAMDKGVCAGYPVVDVGVTVLDGKEHPVDSSEMSFKIAARNAFKDAMRNAGPILLEPIMNLTVFVENDYLGDIMSDLSSRRGRILGQTSPASGIDEIQAQVPHKELLRYAIDLRSMTSGTGSFEMNFDHYDPISGKVASGVIAEAEAFMEEQED